jgi:hypothetical protein
LTHPDGFVKPYVRTFFLHNPHIPLLFRGCSPGTFTARPGGGIGPWVNHQYQHIIQKIISKAKNRLFSRRSSPRFRLIGD